MNTATKYFVNQKAPSSRWCMRIFTSSIGACKLRCVMCDGSDISATRSVRHAAGSDRASLIRVAVRRPVDTDGRKSEGVLPCIM